MKYGTTRDYVLAMTVVLPSGEVLRLGREVAKTSSGYSLLHLMIGSEGALGVITELSMKLIPNPKEDMSFILSFSDIQTAIAAVPKIKACGFKSASYRVYGARYRGLFGRIHGEQNYPHGGRRQ